jgi:spore cortex formation protein SpoVR/YcgB (stage V sporulation)
MQDIERIAHNPTDEDREWFKGQEWVGSGDHMKEILYAVENFKDESFIQQYLSPKLMRDFKMFVVHDDEDYENLIISDIHNNQGYKNIRSSLSKQYSLFHMVPNIQVYNVDRWDTRILTLQHQIVDGVPLNENKACQTLEYLAYLWEYGVELESLDEEGEIEILYEFKQYDEKVEISYF